MGQWEQALKRTKDLEEWAIDCLKESKTGCRAGEGRNKPTLRVIKFSSRRPSQSSVKVEEYEV